MNRSFLGALLLFAAPAWAELSDGGSDLDGGGEDGGVGEDPASWFLQKADQLGTSLRETNSLLDTLDAGTGGPPQAIQMVVRETLQQHVDFEKLPDHLGELPELKELFKDSERAYSAAQQFSEDYAIYSSRPTRPGALKLEKLVEQLKEANEELASSLQSGASAFKDRVAPTSIVVSGGVSLGSYQAGLLHFYTQYLLRHRQEVKRLSKSLSDEPVMITGASAGSINALLSALAGCRQPIRSPEDSLFWKVWIPVDLADLVAEGNGVTPLSLLSRKPIDDAVDKLNDAWADDQWLEQPCRVNLGFTVTREAPREVHLNTPTDDDSGQVMLPVQTERVVLVLSGSGKTAPDVYTWQPSSKEADNDLFVRFEVSTPSGQGFPADAAKVLKASASFPLAWSPMPLQVKGEPQRSLFLDGGVFDNNPVRLAERLSRWSRIPAVEPLERDLMRSRSEGAVPPRVLYVEPDATPWSGKTLFSPATRRNSFLAMYSQLLASLVSTARKAELVSTIEEDASIRQRLDVPLRKWPIAGAFLMNFFAFLDEDFRRFDFYSGMADAREYLYRQLRGSPARSGLGEVAVDSPELDCVLAFRKADGRQSAMKLSACENLIKNAKPEKARGAKNLLALLEASDRVRDFIYECIEKVDGCEPGKDLEIFSAELDRQGFIFANPALRARTVIEAVREQLHPLLDTFAWQQATFPERAMLAVTGKMGLDAFSYRPSRWYLGLGLHSRNGLEAEYSHHVRGPFRLTGGLQATRFQSRFLSGSGPLADERYSITLGGYVAPLSLEWGPQSYWWVKLAGQAGANAELTTVGLEHGVWRFPVQLTAGLTFVQRLYVRAAVKFFPFDSCADGVCPLLNPAYASDVQQIAGTRRDWSVSLGWRFIE